MTLISANIEHSLLKIIRIILTFAILVNFSSCDKCDDCANKECDNYNLCCELKAESLDFEVSEELFTLPDPEALGFSAKPTPSDTTIPRSRLFVEANILADNYEWIIGNDTVLTSDKDAILITPPLTPGPNGERIRISLKTTKKVELDCDPSGVFEQTVEKTIVVMPLESSKALGMFTGRLESDPSRNREFEFGLINLGSRVAPFIKGLMQNCSTSDWDNQFSLTYRSFYFNTRVTKVGCCNGLSMFAEVNEKNTIKATVGYFQINPIDSCQWSVINDTYMLDTFIGIKQN